MSYNKEILYLPCLTCRLSVNISKMTNTYAKILKVVFLENVKLKLLFTTTDIFLKKKKKRENRNPLQLGELGNIWVSVERSGPWGQRNQRDYKLHVQSCRNLWVTSSFLMTNSWGRSTTAPVHSLTVNDTMQFPLKLEERYVI